MKPISATRAGGRAARVTLLDHQHLADLVHVRAYHLDENILRFLTISFDKRTLNVKNAYFEKKQMELAEKEKEAYIQEEAAGSSETQGNLDNPKEETEPNS